MQVQVSPSFKKMTSKAIIAIVIFIFVYLLLLILGLAITALSIWGGIALIISKPMFFTIIIGVGLIGVGFFIFIFLFKFLFSKHKIDRSHLIEISESEEPRLFTFIRDIVQQVDTTFPKRIYLSADVNASVFYDSNFWSMIFPVRKNLQIGLGLVNTITEQEFKAILAHEFGHFSQRSMKVGSYVYNVNKVIYNMLYENSTMEKLMKKWSGLSNYFSIFVLLAVRIIEGMQWILKKMYAYVNLNYMALSREMEFHADEVAANVAGYSSLKESLLRLDLANYSYSSVIDFYNAKVPDNVKSNNIYKEQWFVMQFLANQSKLPYKNNLPVVSEQDLRMYNKSKLTIKDQWASHPKIEERIKALELTNIIMSGNDTPAIDLFDNAKKTQEVVTEKLFADVPYTQSPHTLELEDFKSAYLKTYHKSSFAPEYNGYYDNKNPIAFDIDSISSISTTETLQSLFGKEKVDMVYEHIAYENDKNALTGIANKEIKIKTFDYDGHKYKWSEAQQLIPKLDNVQQSLKESILQNDQNIYKFFYQQAEKNGNAALLKEKYKHLFKLDAEFDTKAAMFQKMMNALSFISEDTPIDQIKERLETVKLLEIEFKHILIEMLADDTLKNELPKQSIENFEKYLYSNLEYFDGKAYNNDNLQSLFTATNDFTYLLSSQYFIAKLNLLKFQMEQLGSNSISVN